MIWAWLACGEPAPAPIGPVAPRHGDGWDSLVRAAERGDVANVRILARDVQLGEVPADRPEADALASALGFLQIAEDADEVEEGMAKARAACEACHRGAISR